MSRHKAYRAIVLLALAGAALTASGSAPGSPENPWLVTAKDAGHAKPRPRTVASPAAALVRRTGEAAPGRFAAEPRTPLPDAGSAFASWPGVDSGTLATPSTSGAVGPHSFLQLVNGAFGLYERTGATIMTGTLADLLPAVPAGGHALAEPQAIWDPATRRFYYVFLDLDPTGGKNYIAYGFSKDDAPQGPADFCRYELDYMYQHLDELPGGDAIYPDSPRLGTTQRFVLIGVDVFDWLPPRGIGASFGADVDWIEKPPAGTTCPPASDFDGHMEKNYGVQDANGSDVVSPVPAVQVDPSATGWVVASASPANGGSRTQVFALRVVDSEPAGAGTGFIPTFPSVSAITVPQFAAPPVTGAPQPGGLAIDTGEAQLGNAVSATDPTRGGVQAIWTQHTVAGATAGVSQVRWYELDPAKKTVLQSGAASPAGLSAFNGAIAPDRLVDNGTTKFGGNMVLGFDTSSVTSPLTVRWLSKEGTGVQGAITAVPETASPVPVAGIGCDAVGGVCAWGGAGAAPDPAAPTSALTGQVWLTNAFASGGTPASANWRTQNVAVHVPLTVPAITSFTPTSGPVGTTVTIKGSRFIGITDVTIGGVSVTVPPPTVTATQIVAKVPEGALTGPITVSNDGGATPPTSNFKVTPKIVPWAPTLLQVGDEFHVLGTNLRNDNGSDAVWKLGSVPVEVVQPVPPDVPDPTDVTLRVPDTVSNKLTVSINGGLASAGSFTTPSNLPIRPTIASLGSSHGFVGSALVIQGKTLAGTTAVRFSGIAGGAPSVGATFKLAAGALTATVPSGAVTGPVSVTNAGGTTTSADSFAVDPKLTSLAPSSGAVGTTVTVTGSGFDGTAVTTFTGYDATTVDAPALPATTSTALKVAVPEGASTGPVTIHKPASAVSLNSAFKVTPKLATLPTGPFQAGETVHLSGLNLEGTLAVTIGKVPAMNVSADLFHVDFEVPAAALTGPVTVTAANGSFTTPDVLHVRPKIASPLNPTHGVAGITVTITGQGLTGTTSVKFTGLAGGQPSVPATTFKVTNGVLTATVPPAAVTGPLTVTSPGGTTGTDSFTVDPKVTSVTPTSSAVGGLITIAGSGFGASPTATFAGGAIAAAEPSNTATSLRFRVPDGALTGPIVVQTSSSLLTASTVTFKVAPTILSFESHVHVGDHVTVPGKNFEGLLSNGLKLGSLVLTQMNPTPTSVAFDVPPTAATGKLSITTAGGTATTDVEVLPQIASITPSPAAAGQVVTIQGSGLNGVKTVQFTGPGSTLVTAPFTTGLKATVPTGAVTGPVTVTTAAPTPAMSAQVVVLPKITSFTPTSGAAGGTGLVTVNGSGFQPNATIAFANTVPAASPSWVSATKLTAKVPMGATTGKLTVANPTDSQSAQSTGNFTVTFSVTGLSATSGKAGDSIQILGLGFVKTGGTASKVFFGGGVQATATVNSANQITATVPAGATSGPITVKNGTTATSSRDSFAVVSLGAASPDHGPTGTEVQIPGTNLATGAVVTLDGAPVDADVTATKVTLTIPDGATGAGVIAVGGLSTTFQITLSLGGLDPTHGHPGDTLTLTGIGLAGVTSVAFGGVSTTDFTNTDGTVVVHVPVAAATGKVTVTAPAGPARSAGTFTVDPPTITGIDPPEGAAGAHVTVTGTGFATGDVLAFGGTPVTPDSVTATTLAFTVPTGVVPPADADGHHDAVVAIANPGDTAHPATTTFRVLADDTWIAVDPLVTPFRVL